MCSICSIWTKINEFNVGEMPGHSLAAGLFIASPHPAAVTRVTITAYYLGTLTIGAELSKVTYKRSLIVTIRQPWRPRLGRKTG